MRKSLILTILLATLVAGVAWGISAVRSAPREIVLVASGMTFYIEGNDTPNPTLQLRPGESVRLTLINRDRAAQLGRSAQEEVTNNWHIDATFDAYEMLYREVFRS